MSNFPAPTFALLVCGLVFAAGVGATLKAQTPAATKPGGPDVVGLRVGMPLPQATSVLQAKYPKTRINITNTKWPDAAKPDVYSDVPMRLVLMNANTEEISVGLTLPPAAPVVWVVRYQAKEQEGINRNTLLSALREKYGKETLAVGMDGQPASDNRIYELQWIFDEQWRPAPSGGYSMSCGIMDDSNFLMTEIRGNSFDKLYLSPWCLSSGILVRAVLMDTDIIRNYETSVYHVPFAIRSAKTSTLAWRAAQDKWKQMQLEKSKTVQPKL